MEKKNFEIIRDENGCLSYKEPRTLSTFKEILDDFSKVDIHSFDCFFAFSKEQFEKGLKSIRLEKREKIIQLSNCMFGTKDGANRFREYAKMIDERIREECDPQEIYLYEYNNYECMLGYDGDKDAIEYIINMWGVDTAKKIKRYDAYFSIDEIVKNID